MIGYFEGINSERVHRLALFRCRFARSCRLWQTIKVPDHGLVVKTRGRLPHEVHEKVFDWVLALVAAARSGEGERVGVDG